VDLAFLSRSYHLEVLGPADQYLTGQYLRCERCKELASRKWEGTERASACKHWSSERIGDRHFRLQSKLGQNYTHLYMRGYANSGLQDLEVLVRFGETPPGTITTAVLVACASVILILSMAQLLANGGGQAGDLPAILLMLPVVAAAWFGFLSDSESLLRSSFLARVSLAASGLLSFVSALLCMFWDSMGTAASSSSWSVLGLSDYRWIGLFLLATANFLLRTGQLVRQLTYYNILLQRRDETRHSVGFGRRRA
jgi:hypothetical protein